MTSEEFLEKLRIIFTDEPVKKNMDTLKNSIKGKLPILYYLKYKTEKGEEITPGDISSNFNISTARVAKSLNNLEISNMVVRQKSKNDKRTTIILLTDKGLAEANEGISYIVSAIEKKLANISKEELEIFFRVINKLVY